MARKKKNKKKTIGVLTQSRGVQAPPTVADENRKKKNDRKKAKEDLRKGRYDD